MQSGRQKVKSSQFAWSWQHAGGLPDREAPELPADRSLLCNSSVLSLIYWLPTEANSGSGSVNATLNKRVSKYSLSRELMRLVKADPSCDNTQY